MTSGDPGEQRGAAAREGVDDALGRLEERLDRASRAAERLLADAAMRVTEGRGAGNTSGAGDTGGADGAGGDAGPESATPPPAGWQEPGAGRDQGSALLGDADLLLGLFAAVRNRIPPDLQQRLAEAIREVLLALRALIDWYLERTDQARSGAAEVEDIPIL
jgi:hypothetical protein